MARNSPAVACVCHRHSLQFRHAVVPSGHAVVPPFRDAIVTPGHVVPSCRGSGIRIQPDTDTCSSSHRYKMSQTQDTQQREKNGKNRLRRRVRVLTDKKYPMQLALGDEFGRIITGEVSLKFRKNKHNTRYKYIYTSKYAEQTNQTIST